MQEKLEEIMGVVNNSINENFLIIRDPTKCIDSWCFAIFRPVFFSVPLLAWPTKAKEKLCLDSL
jgi:hypothetical protein